MIAYHVSTENYEVGRIITTNNYFNVTLMRKNEWVEDLLESNRPTLYPKRTECVFSFAKIEELAYYSDRRGSQDLKYYEVELLSRPIKCPMILCQSIKQNKEKGVDVLNSLAIEYWGNTLDWNFYELLCDSFKVVGQINAPNIREKIIGMGMYEKDKIIAEQLLVIH